MDSAHLIAPAPARRSVSSRVALDLPAWWLSAAVTCAFVAALLFVAVPRLIVQDTWLTLVSGREVVDHGLPAVDHLTRFASGRPWVDQQWLAQVLFYGASVLGGIKAMLLLQIGACLAGFAFLIDSAYRRGASSATVSALAIGAIAAAPWGLQVRAQGLALGLFGATLALLLRDPNARSRRTLLAIPLLCIWANVHGSVVLGVVLVMFYGTLAWIRERNAAAGHKARCLALVVLPPLALFASPYGLALAGYYRTMLVDPPFAGYNVEWQRTSPSLVTAVFFLLAAVTIVTLVVKRSRFTMFDIATLLVTLASALSAVRGIVWFSLAAVAILPPALRRDHHRAQTKGFGFGAAAAISILAAACIVFARTPAADYTSQFPPSLAAAVAKAAGPSGTVFADDRHADWLLWQVPALRGRVAYDVRFELLKRHEIARLDAYVHYRGKQWASPTTSNEVVVGDVKHVSRVARLRGLPIVYNRDGTAVAARLSGEPS